MAGALNLQMAGEHTYRLFILDGGLRERNTG